ncbi:MAG: hypothetical protein K2F74_08935 [Muribaculaceae bacterium]|nr:hypothetical protein [Muribaculaceae bacterium]
MKDTLLILLALTLCACHSQRQQTAVSLSETEYSRLSARCDSIVSSMTAIRNLQIDSPVIVVELDSVARPQRVSIKATRISNSDSIRTSGSIHSRTSRSDSLHVSDSHQATDIRKTESPQSGFLVIAVGLLTLTALLLLRKP